MFLQHKKLTLLSFFITFSWSIAFAQFATNNSNSVAGDSDFTSDITRDGSMGVGADNPLPSAIKLFVKGRLSQEFSGTIGLTTPGNTWASLGESFTPAAGNIPIVYGLLRQSGGAGYISGIKDNAHGVAAWSGNGRMDFDWIDANFQNQTFMSILNDGNVGIGKNNPGAKLEIDGGPRWTSNGWRKAIKINNANAIQFDAGANSKFGLGASSSGNRLYFFTTSTESDNVGATYRMVIQNDGNVGIGQGNPGAKLEVNGGPRWTSNGWRKAVKINNANAIQFDAGANSKFGIGASSSGNRLYFFTTSTESDNVGATYRMVIQNDGKVGIGKSNPQYNLDVNGTAACTGGFWSSSDERFKEDIKTVEKPNEKIALLNGVTYKFKKQQFGDIDFTKSSNRKEYGFLAQELKKVFPELVNQDKDGYYSVRYEGLIPVLVEALKDQNTEIKDQNKTIEYQNEELKDIKDRMNEMKKIINNISNSGKVGFNTSSDLDILKQNTPNPFDSTTTIEYELPNNISPASLVIYDLGGKVFKSFSIDGKGSINLNTEGLANGTYIYAIEANGQSIARQKMVVQK